MYICCSTPNLALISKRRSVQESPNVNKSSAAAEMGDCGHYGHGMKKGGWGCCAPFVESWDPV